MPSTRNLEFSRTLCLLRQEKGISQRLAAQELNVSQALLSHYENAVREPGLDFVVRASDYYGVSADFMLGRTMSRDGTTIFAQEVYDSTERGDNVMRGSVLATLNKKIMSNAVCIIFDLLGRAGNRTLISEASSYLGTALYTVFRAVYSVSGKNPDSFFPTPSHVWKDAADADMHRSRMRFDSALAMKPLPSMEADESFEMPELSNDSLAREYPLLYQSILKVLHSAGERMNKNL